MQRFASFLLSIMLLGGNLAAQSTYSAITGTVTDPTGAVVPGVKVTAINTATNISTSTEANAAGVYTVAQLMPGTYTLRATLAGFREFRADQLVLEARTYRRLDITMQVGNLTEKVEVTAGISAIETERAKIGDTRQREELLTLPLRASGSTAFLSLTPGVKKLTGSSLATFDGSKAWEGSYSIDGTSYSNASQSGWEPVSNSLEMFAEIKVEHANNSAEFNTLGQVTVVTRSGANQPHGAVFDNYGAPGFRASNPFSRTKGIMVNHRYGASFGGPIWIPKVYDGRNRTFFFINTEMQTQNTNSTTLRPTVAPEPWRRGDFSRFGTPLRDPQGTTPFPGAIIPAARLSAVSRRVQETWFPLPNMGDPNVLSQNNYQSTMSWPYRAPQMFGVRLDQRIGDKDSLFARLSYTGLHQNAWESSLPANRPTEGFWPMKAVTLSYTRVFSSRLLNEFRYGYLFVNNVLYAPWKGLPVVQEMGLQGLAANLPDAWGLPSFTFGTSGLDGLNVRGQVGTPGTSTIMHQFQDHVSYYQGTHSVKAGFDVRSYREPKLAQDSCLFGCLTFNNVYTAMPGVAGSGHAYADFLLGLPDTARRASPALLTEPQNRFLGLFVTDNWKATQRLTLDIGVRWDLMPPQTELNSRLAVFDPGRGAVVVPDKALPLLSPLLPRDYVPFVKASEAGLPQTLIGSDRNNVAPRFGFAWRPGSGTRTVIRGGYGIYFTAGSISTNKANTSPFVLAEPSFINTRPNPTLQLPQVFPAGGPSSGLTSVTLPAAVNPDLKVSYTQQVSFTVEREFLGMALRTSYIGTLGRQRLYSWNLNSPPIDDRLFVDKQRPFPKYPAISYTDNGANYNYNALNVELNRKFSNGLYYKFGWTWARDVGDFSTDNAGLENPFDRARDRGPHTATTTHRATLAYVYDLPFGRGQRWMSSAPKALDLVAGGWRLSGAAYLQTGHFLTPLIRVPDPTGTSFTTGRNRPNISIRPDYLRNTNLDSPTTARWFDSTSFAAPPVGRFGNSGVGVLIGPNQMLWHTGMYKYVRFSENERTPKLRLGVQITNILNHTNYGAPNTQLADPFVGTISGTGGYGGVLGDGSGMREAEVSLRIEW